MAIVIEEERAHVGSPINVIIWIVMLAIVAVGMYYLFFTQPELVEYVAPASFQGTEQIARAQIDPSGILNDSRFRDLRQYVTLPDETNFGRVNPFLGFGTGEVLPVKR